MIYIWIYEYPFKTHSNIISESTEICYAKVRWLICEYMYYMIKCYVCNVRITSYGYLRILFEYLVNYLITSFLFWLLIYVAIASF